MASKKSINEYSEKGTHNVFVTLGASNHALEERVQHDFYATDPKALELLLELETFENVWEPSCGLGHLSEVLKKHGIHGKSSDLIDRGYGEVQDFLDVFDSEAWNGDIITNPPFKQLEEFIEHALEIIPEGRKVAMFMGIQFVEGKARRKFIEKYPIKTIYVSSSRLNCARNGDFETYGYSSARCYAWYIWEKGYKGETTLRWFN